MFELTINQFHWVENVFSMAIGILGAAAVFFFIQRAEVAPRFRVMVTVLGVISIYAAYNYLRLLESWNRAFLVFNNVVQNTGYNYDDTYRYTDWFVAVPLLLVALVLALEMPARQAQVRAATLGLLSVEMIALGYIGTVATTKEARLLWGACAMVPYLLIIFQLYIRLAKPIADQPMEVRPLLSLARNLTVLIWCIYPVIYVLPAFDIGGTEAFIAVQIAYATADVSAKAIYGLLLYTVAARRSRLVGELAAQATSVSALSAR